MANRSVFGASAPPYTLTAYNDGTPNIIMGTYFYVTGAAGWRNMGARVYVTDASVFNIGVTFSVWVSTTTPADMSTTPLATATATTPSSAGWAEATWSSPITMNNGDFFLIAYAFDSPHQAKYLHAPNPSANAIPSVEGVDLYMAEQNIPGVTPLTERSRFRIGAAATDYTRAWYGVDIIANDDNVRSGNVKVWDGASWVGHPVKVWDGASWVEHKAKGYDGTWIIGK